MLQLSKNLKDKDGELANAYLGQAKDIYSIIAELPDYSDNRGVTEELWFYLNAGLYYMTGEGAYREETEKYIRSVEKIQLFSRDDSEEKLSRDEYFR